MPLRRPALLAMVALLSAAPPAWAAPGFSLTAVPSLAVQLEQDSNVMDSVGGGPDDTILVLSPALAGDLRVEGGQFRLRLQCDGRFYRNFPQHNYFGWTREAVLQTVTPLQVTPRFTLSPAGGVSYREETNTPGWADTAQAAPLPENAEGRTRIRESLARVGSTVLATPLDTVSLSAYWRDFTYLSGANTGVGTTSYGLDGSVLHQFSQRFSSGVYGAVSRGEYEDNTFSLAASGGLTARWSLSPSLSADARGGYAVTRSQSGDTAGLPEGSLALSYVVPRNQAQLSVNRRYEVGGGLGAETRRIGLQAVLNHQFTGTTSGRLEGSWEKRQGESVESIDRDIFQGGARLTWFPFRYLSCHLSGYTIRERDHVTGSTRIEKDVVSIGFTFSEEYLVL